MNANTVVKRSYPGDLVWEYGGTEWVFRSSFPGSIRWVEDLPTVDDFDDYLSAAVDPDQLLDLTAHILASKLPEDRSAMLVEQVGDRIEALDGAEVFGEAERYRAAQASGRKAQGHVQVLDNLGAIMEQQRLSIEHNAKVLADAKPGKLIGEAEVVEAVDVEVQDPGPFEG